MKMKLSVKTIKTKKKANLSMSKSKAHITFLILILHASFSARLPIPDSQSFKNSRSWDLGYRTLFWPNPDIFGCATEI